MPIPQKGPNGEEMTRIELVGGRGDGKVRWIEGSPPYAVFKNKKRRLLYVYRFSHMKDDPEHGLTELFVFDFVESSRTTTSA